MNVHAYFTFRKTALNRHVIQSVVLPRAEAEGGMSAGSCRVCWGHGPV